MVRLILLIILIFFVVWILRPFLITRDGMKNKVALERLLNSDENYFKQKNIILSIISTVILLALVVWLLPKFGINFLALFQKIIPFVSSLRGILPF